MDFDDSVMLPAQGDDDSFLLSARPIYAIKHSVPVVAERVETESKRGNGERKLENGRRRTEDLVAKLRRDREERKKREVRDRAISSPSSRSERDTERRKGSRVVDELDKTEWEDVREVEQEKEINHDRNRQGMRQRIRSPTTSPAAGEDHVAKLKARLAESRMKRDISSVAKENESGSQAEPEPEPVLMFRNRALAKIMCRGDRPARPKAERDASQPKPPKQESSSILASAHIEETSPTITSAYEDRKSKGDRLIEKLLRSGPIGPKRSEGARADSRPIEKVSIPLPPPVASTSRATSPVIGLEKIDEQTQEEHGSDSVALAVIPEVSQHPCKQEESAAIPEIIEVSTTVEPVQPVPSVPTDESAADATDSSHGPAPPSRPIKPAYAEEDIVVEEKPVKPEATLPQMASTIVDDAPEPTTASTPVTPPAQRPEEQWEDVDAEQAVVDPEPTKPVVALNQAMFPGTSLDSRMAELLMPVQAQAGPSARRPIAMTAAVAQSRRLRTTCPRTPVFARSKRMVARESPTKRVAQSRPAERLAGTRSSVTSRVERPTASYQRSALNDLPLEGHNRSMANKIAPPVVEGIARKPSSIVKIPDFEKAHKIAEIKVKRAPPRLTRPDSGKTPGRTSRARMMERAQFDKANRDYQQRREDAMKRFKQEKEDAAWAAELELRKAIAFRANPVPEFIRAPR